MMIFDELDKGASKCDLAHRTGVNRSTVQRIAANRERYIGEPSESPKVG